MKTSAYSLIVAALFLSNTAFANLMDFIETVTVGNPGNFGHPTYGYGAVSYEYEIGKYEVTNAQWTTFLNAVASESDPYGLYSANMGSNSLGGIIRSGSPGEYVYEVKPGFADRPVNYVSFGDAARFANWLTNGQGSGSTESGAYDMSQPLVSMVRSEPVPGMQSQVFVSSVNEWVKAAYYDPTLNDGAGGYWFYPTMSNDLPANGVPPGSGNNANYGGDGGLGELTVVGAYIDSSSYYGTFDQEGNVAEFTDTIFGSGQNRIRRGSSYGNTLTGINYRGSDLPTTETNGIGFRISVIQIPESSTFGIVASVIALIASISFRKRK